ncbi:MAG: hypothetical protein NZL93_03040, partial [Chthoniobacterales bacterium]|nr:hypothetical protein [Chthoniobacterales bacterium]
DLRSAGVQAISLSLDGTSPHSHDSFRGLQGTWNRTWQSIHAAQNANLSLQINTTISRQNLHEIDKFPDILLQINPTTWSIFLLVPTGRAQSNDLISAQQTEDLFQKLATLSTQLPFNIKTTEGHHYRRILLQRNLAKPNSPGMLGLADGRGFVFISHTGEIYPSGFLPISAGNVRTHDLLDVYRNSPLFRDLRNPNLLKGKCGYCPFRSICGGSRSRAYALTGDYLAPEPLCSYQPPNTSITPTFLSN